MNNAIDLKSTEVSAFSGNGFFSYKQSVSSAALNAGGAVANLNKELSKGTVLDIRTLLSHLKAAGAAAGKSQAWDSLVKQARRICRARGWKLSTTKGFPVEPIKAPEMAPETETAPETAPEAPAYSPKVETLTLEAIKRALFALPETDQHAIMAELAENLGVEILTPEDMKPVKAKRTRKAA